MAELISSVGLLRWDDLSADRREALTGKLSGLWGAASDQAAFDSLSIDKQEALLLVIMRLQEKDLWQEIKGIDNVYGEGGVGLEFTASATLESKLLRRRDFTQFLARHSDTQVAFYEKRQAEAALHLLYVEEKARKWYVHFDLYSPVNSPISALKHFWYEFLGNVRPDWRAIKQRLII